MRIFELTIGSRLEEFMDKAFSHLVDSNVFLRSIILSSFRFYKDYIQKVTEYEPKLSFDEYIQKSKLMSIVYQNLNKFIPDLIKTVQLKNLTSTNLSCLNSVICSIILEVNILKKDIRNTVL